MDFIHSERVLEETDSDYICLSGTDDFPYDIKFYAVKVYYHDDNDDLQNECCPAMLLATDTKACQVGAGI